MIQTLLSITALVAPLRSSAAASRETRRWALVTGASSGIGEALAKRAAARGYNVLLAARRKSRLDSLAGELRSSGVAVAVCPCDLGTASGVEHLCTASLGLDLGLACLNAGFCSPADAFAAQPAAEVDTMLDLNVRATTRLLGHCASAMVASGRGGRVLLVASSAGAAPGVPGVAAYAATKAYLRSLAAGVGAELRRGRSGVSVTCALPSAVDTEFAATSSLEHAAVFTLPGVRQLGGIVMSADAVAAAALDATLRGQAEVVPGLLPSCYVGLTDRRLLPRPLARGIAAFSFGRSPLAAPAAAGGDAEGGAAATSGAAAAPGSAAPSKPDLGAALRRLRGGEIAPRWRADCAEIAALRRLRGGALPAAGLGAVGAAASLLAALVGANIAQNGNPAAAARRGAPPPPRVATLQQARALRRKSDFVRLWHEAAVPPLPPPGAEALYDGELSRLGVLAPVSAWITNTLFGPAVPWRGKALAAGGGVNLFGGGRGQPPKLRRRGFAARVGASRLDGRPCLILDYADGARGDALWGGVLGMRDELREVRPGLLLGLGSMRATGGAWNAAPFVLEERAPE